MTVGNTRHERGCPTCARVHCAFLMKQLGNPTCSAGLGRPRHLLFALKYAGINPAGLKSLMRVCHFYRCFFSQFRSWNYFFSPPRQSGPNYSRLEERLSLQGNIKGLQTPPPTPPLSPPEGAFSRSIDRKLLGGNVLTVLPFREADLIRGC